MAKVELNVKNLHAEVEGKSILRGVDLTVRGGEIHVIMGPNGTGKSTLASTIMGHPAYEATEGSVQLDGQELLEMEVDERARAGLFLAMQYPAEISGVTNSDFIRSAINARLEKPIRFKAFQEGMKEAMKSLSIPENMPERFLNDGFSGGEKKRNEIFQMLMLKPRLVMLDEIDSGLDIDAVRIVGQNVMDYAAKAGEDCGFLVITHYKRLLDYIKADYIHVLMDGKIVYTGGPELADKLEADGYDWLREEVEKKGE